MKMYSSISRKSILIMIDNYFELTYNYDKDIPDKHLEIYHPVEKGTVLSKTSRFSILSDLYYFTCGLK